MKTQGRLSLFSLVAIGALLLAGCTGDSSDGPYKATPMQEGAAGALVRGIDALAPPQSPDQVDANGRTLIIAVRDQVRDGLRYDVEARKLNYPFTDPQGREHRVSGLLVLPHELEKGNVLRAPILLYNHGTVLTRAEAPSHIVEHPLDFTDNAEAVIGVMYARSGYIVAMADYSGLGDDLAMHPYMHTASAIATVLGMLDATKACVAGKVANCQSFPASIQWDGRIFIMGYSQGGAVTLGTARELQSRGVRVESVAAMASPCDLSGAMRLKMLEPKVSKAPFFLPYVILGYRDAYDRRADGSFDPNGLFEPARSFAGDYVTRVPPLFDGVTDAKTVDSKLPKVPRDLLSQMLLTDLETPSSRVIETLRANDTYTWMPGMPLLLLHHPDDDLVPWSNSDAAWNHMKSAAGVRFGNLLTALDLGSIHAGAAPEAFVRALLWLNASK